MQHVSSRKPLEPYGGRNLAGRTGRVGKPVTTTRLLLFLALAPLRLVRGFAVVGYVPDYRFGSINWDNVLQRTTHLILFSLEPTADGDLKGADPTSPQMRVLQQGSVLELAMRKAGKDAPKLIYAVGGAARSKAFPAVAAEQQLRKKLAKRLAGILKAFPLISGFDLAWEAPESEGQFRDLGKFAVDVRSAINRAAKEINLDTPLVTMTYHPLIGAVQVFGGLKSKSNGKRFVDLFDLFHSLAYSKYDDEKRHSTYAIAKGTIDEWEHHSLPLSKLTLGMPLFGLSKKDGGLLTVAQILEQESGLLRQTWVDETEDGCYFNNFDTVVKKVKLAATRGIGGVMLWELGQDMLSAKGGPGMMLRKVWNTARREAGVVRGGQVLTPSSNGWLDQLIESLTDKMPAASDDFAIIALASIIGAVFTVKTLFSQPPQHRQLAMQRRLARAARSNPKDTHGTDNVDVDSKADGTQPADVSSKDD
eukprot:TRINITY_DN14581_c0_g1_i1.p1 TRINITY_DN14581_c0_g1~~TRINITY_DN14581_c0_g1_i1.p1  ORF type:complete len:490 (-),score=70.56 TRINITY_DN14581_c0_g1_i1:36-1466(-)